MLNFFFVDDPNQHVVEIQFIHKKLQTQRVGWGYQSRT